MGYLSIRTSDIKGNIPDDKVITVVVRAAEKLF